MGNQSSGSREQTIDICSSIVASIPKEPTKLCLPCKRNKEETCAVFWCNNCNEGLCQACNYHHTRNRLCVHHKVSLLSDIHSELLLLDRLQINTQCAKHPDHLITNFCEDDDIFCCTVCSSTDHRKCENVYSIDQAYEAYTSNIREADIIDANTLLALTDQMIEKRKLAIKKAKEISHDSLICTQFQFEVTMNQLQQARTRIEWHIKEAEQNVTQCHNQCLNAYENMKKELYDNLQVLHAHHKLSPAQDMMARHRTIHAINRQAKETLHTVSSDILEMKISLSDNLNMNDINFGTVAIEQWKSDESVFLPECDLISARLYRHLSNKGTAQIARELVPLIACDISSLGSAEKSNIQAGNWTPDGTYLPDNTILLCDRHNIQLIKLDENLGFLEKLPVSGLPYGVCVSSDGNHVHVVCDDNKVVSYTLQGPWREIHRFSTEDYVRGIACHGDKIVTGHGNRVVVYDSKGRKVSRITTSGHSWYTAVSRDGRMLYHADEHDVVCRSLEDVTQEVWRYSSQELGYPHGIDTDREGNTLIVGLISQNVHQVSGVGNINRILVNKIKRPFGLFYNRNNNTFCVTLGDRDDKVCVEMYRFEDSYKSKSTPNTQKQKLNIQ